MYTRCPECQTAFKVTLAQLKARDGLVRCGRCDSVFRADLRLFAPPTSAAGPVPESEPAFVVDEEADNDTPLDLDEKEIPVVYDLSVFQTPRRGLPTAVWVLGALVAAALLTAQFVYFYRNELAQLPGARPYLAQLCDVVQTLISCELASPPGALVPELLETRIAPHPRFANALRIRASLVNRTEQAQSLPLMQVSLTDSNGQLLARRTFAPGEYAEFPARAAVSIGPNVVVVALLDIVNPEGKAAGYEIQLFPQQFTRPN